MTSFGFDGDENVVAELERSGKRFKSGGNSPEWSEYQDNDIEIVFDVYEIPDGDVARVEAELTVPLENQREFKDDEEAAGEALENVPAEVAPADEKVELGALAVVAEPVREFVERRARRIVRISNMDASDNATVQALINQYRKAQETHLAAPFYGPVEQTTGTGATSGSPKTAITQAFVKRATNVPTTRMAFASVTQGGKWHKAGLVSGPNVKNTVRDLQIANQLSEAMVQVTGATEVEAMILADRILVSANEKAVVAKLCTYTLDGLLTEAGKKADSPWAKRKVEKLSALRAALLGQSAPADPALYRLATIVADCQIFPAQSAAVIGALSTLKSAGQLVVGGSPQQAAAMIADPQHAGEIIVVDANETKTGPCSHAEQNLALALLKATPRPPVASIAGGKRPCTICYLSLCLTQKYGLGALRFNHHPGGYWKGTTAVGLQGIAAELKLSQQELTEQMKDVGQDGVEQYVTNTDADAAVSMPVPDLRNVVKFKTYETDTGSPSQSQEYDDYLQEVLDKSV